MRELVHSAGMVSFDVEDLEFSEATERELKGTEFYKRLEGFVGREQANRIIEESGKDKKAVSENIVATNP
jgi:hypothetical protein